MHPSADPQNIMEMDAFVLSFTLSGYFTPRLNKHFFVPGLSERFVSSKLNRLEGGISDPSGFVRVSFILSKYSDTSSAESLARDALIFWH